MTPAFAPAPQVAPIRAIELCGETIPGLAPEALLTALGAISNLYCLYHLDHPKTQSVTMQGFAAHPIASREQILAAIRNAVWQHPKRLTKKEAESILQSLERALAACFASHHCQSIRVIGFGVISAVDVAEMHYSLQLESPRSSASQISAFRAS